MASIENIGTTDFRPHCMAMDEPELIGQQLVQQGAIHALTTLLESGCDEEVARGMLESLRENMRVIEEVARQKGYAKLFTEET